MITKNKRKKIAEAAKEWLGTPHINAHKQKGVGVDCARLPEACIEDAGLAYQDFANVPTDYTSDWFLRDGENIMLPFFKKYCTEIQSVADIQEGDFLLYQIGRQIGHAAIYIGNNEIIHSFPETGVVKADMDSDFHLFDKKGRSRLRKIYRFKAEVL